MSKHIFEQTIDDQTYEVQIGWDKPLQRYYGVISPWVEGSEMDDGGYFDSCDPAWSNLFSGRDLGLDEIVDACTDRGLTMPETLLDNVVDDRLRNAVNEITLYENGHVRRIDLNQPFSQPE